MFFTALVLSSLLALVPLRILWYLDRRERESPWLFAAAFFWGGLIATGLSLPFNTAFAARSSTPGSRSTRRSASCSAPTRR